MPFAIQLKVTHSWHTWMTGWNPCVSDVADVSHVAMATTNGKIWTELEAAGRLAHHPRV